MLAFRPASVLLVGVLCIARTAADAQVVITTVEELQAIQNDLSADYILGNDIDASDTVNWNGGAGFIPIGDVDASFHGNFDGAGHTISDLYIDSDLDYVGLFGRVVAYSNQSDSRRVSNVVLENVFVRGGYVTGALAGGAGRVIVENVSITGTTRGDAYIGGTTGTGGVVGSGRYEMRNVSFVGSVSGTSRVGGLAGSAFGALFSQCSAAVQITGDYYVGGIVGNGSEIAISECSVLAESAVQASGYSVGGVAGEIRGGFLLNSYSHADVSGASRVGGLVGSFIAYETSHDTAFVTNCLSTGPVSAAGTMGGLIGTATGHTVRASFWDIETSGLTVSAGGVGLVTSELQAKNVYRNAGWDFTQEWALRGKTYPSTNSVLDVAVLSHAVDLQEMASDLNRIYIVLRNIDTSRIGWQRTRTPFVPVGSTATPFNGRFYGAGYFVDDLFIDRPGSPANGLFGATSSTALISDLVVRGATVTGGDNSGVVVGEVVGSTLQHIQVIASSVRGGENVGGVAGQVSQGATLRYMDVRADVEASSGSAGGVAGAVSGTTIESARTDTNTSASSKAGGVVGDLTESSLTLANAYGGIVAAQDAGGLVGAAIESDISNSLTGAEVEGVNAIGGAVGSIQGGSLDAVLAYGSVTGDSLTGGLVGLGGDGIATFSYWDAETSGQLQSAGGELKTTSELYAQAAYDGATWDFDGIWAIRENVYYPYLQWHPYTFVTTLQELQDINLALDANYVLLNDIDASESNGWNGGEGFVPIPEFGSLVGSLNGFGNAIDGLVIRDPTGSSSAALFGGLGVGSVVEHLNLTNVDVSVTSGEYFQTGALAGSVIGGTIADVHITGRVSGPSPLGGMAGYSEDSHFSNISVRAIVSGTGESVGGIVGSSNWSNIVNSYSASQVSGTRWIGGLFGASYASDVVGSASLSDVSGTDTVGGIGGYMAVDLAVDVHASGAVAGNMRSGGLAGSAYASVENAYQPMFQEDYDVKALFGSYIEGQPLISTYWNVDVGYAGANYGQQPLTTEEMRQSASFVGWDFASVWDIVEGETFPYLRKLVEMGDDLDALVSARDDFESLDLNADGLLSFGEARLPYAAILHDVDDDGRLSFDEIVAVVGEPPAILDVWVDFAYVGIELGTELEPFDSLAEAVATISPGGTIHVAKGSTPETITFISPVTVSAVGGKVIIGAP